MKKIIKYILIKWLHNYFPVFPNPVYESVFYITDIAAVLTQRYVARLETNKDKVKNFPCFS